MKIVTAAEAAQRLHQATRSTSMPPLRHRQCCSMRLLRAPTSCATSRSSTSTSRVLARTSRRRWLATSFIGRCSSARMPARRQRGPRRIHPGVPVGRPGFFRRGILPLDAVLVNVSPPDDTAFARLGTSVIAMPAAIKAAKIVIAQINAQMPRTLGDTLRPRRRDRFRGQGQYSAVHASPAPGQRRRARIGQQIANMVPDGATVQMGIGAIPSAVASALHGKRDLGIHTEMMTDVVLDLVEAGIVTGAHKEINADASWRRSCSAPSAYIDWVDDNPMVEMRSPRLHERHGRHPPVQENGRNQLGDRDRPHRSGVRRLDRFAHVHRRRRPDGLRPRRGAGR